MRAKWYKGCGFESEKCQKVISLQDTVSHIGARYTRADPKWAYQIQIVSGFA